MNPFPRIGKEWTVFLDRDGVINRRRVDDYVKHIDEWDWLTDSLESIVKLSHEVKRVVVVTNQQGIGKGVMTEQDLKEVHEMMLKAVKAKGGEIAAVLHCPHLKSDACDCRKPKIGMFLQAQQMYPDIRPAHCVMVGDSSSDMEWAQKAGMWSVAVGGEAKGGDIQVASLWDFVKIFEEDVR
jgi:histidinol-phosphate phosphatase family protein